MFQISFFNGAGNILASSIELGACSELEAREAFAYEEMIVAGSFVSLSELDFNPTEGELNREGHLLFLVRDGEIIAESDYYFRPEFCD